jgi:hypothetical protein
VWEVLGSHKSEVGSHGIRAMEEERSNNFLKIIWNFPSGGGA